MSSMFDNVLLVLSGGGGLLAAQWGAAFFKGRSEDRRTDRAADLKVEEHRDNLTLEMLAQAQDYLKELHEEVKALRPLQTRIAHLEEALDHVHALLHAETLEEHKAAERRARAFLKRMRPEIGDLRNAIQTADSTNAVAKRIKEARNDG